VVSGFGPIGAGATLAAMADGASEVVVLEPDPDRRRMASELGAHAVDPVDTVSVRELHGFADAGFECSGADGTLRTALRLVRPGGRVVIPGVAHAPAELNLRNLVLTERSVVGSVGYRGDIARAVTLMASGVIDPTILSGPTISLWSLPEWLASTSSAAALKVLVDPGPDRSAAPVDVKSSAHHDADEVP
jgi:(R,R)-butanediol dehydrogenase / meso-butanediol dehydrogenase / diacetyl reductase